jgi:hypothetical protein
VLALVLVLLLLVVILLLLSLLLGHPLCAAYARCSHVCAPKLITQAFANVQAKHFLRCVKLWRHNGVHPPNHGAAAATAKGKVRCTPATCYLSGALHSGITHSCKWGNQSFRMC